MQQNSILRRAGELTLEQYSFETISCGLCRLLGIAPSSIRPKAIPQGGPLSGGVDQAHEVEHELQHDIDGNQVSPTDLMA